MAYGAFPSSLKTIIENDANSAHWPMDDDSWEDVSGNGHHLRTVGTVSYDDGTNITNLGDRGHGYAGSNANHWDLVGHNATRIKQSVSLWVHDLSTMTSSNDAIIGAFGDGWWKLQKESSSTARFWHKAFGDSTTFSSAISLTGHSGWTHIVIVFDSSTPEIKIYFDGTLKLNHSADLWYSETAELHILPEVSGGVQEVSYFANHLLTTDEISALYNNGDGVGWNFSAGGDGGSGSSGKNFALFI